LEALRRPGPVGSKIVVHRGFAVNNPETGDVKERQFRIGYGIERLEGLISAYWSEAV